MYRLIFDPGHGGRDPGALGPSTQEKNNSLSLAKKTAAVLNENGRFNILLTRTEDEDFCGSYFNVEDDLRYRVELANDKGGDLFISFHNNSAAVKAYGNEVYAWQPGGEAEKLAEKVNGRMAAQLGMIDRGVKYVNLYVCRKTAMPAILVEYGFINAEEQTILSKMNQAALAIAQGIGDYFGMLVESGANQLGRQEENATQEENQGKEERRKVKNLVIYKYPEDERAAGYLADYLHCPIAQWEKQLDGNTLLTAENVFQIGGAAINDQVKLISGLTAVETAQKVLQLIQ